MVETWYKIWCSECNSVNWFCNGDEADLSKIDIEGCKCWNCGKVEYFDEEMSEDQDWELGRETPD
jgi:hypothetical protein